MWLWSLAAYEIVRIMIQARHCFSKELTQRFARIKEGAWVCDHNGKTGQERAGDIKSKPKWMRCNLICLLTQLICLTTIKKKAVYAIAFYLRFFNHFKDLLCHSLRRR